MTVLSTVPTQLQCVTRRPTPVAAARTVTAMLRTGATPTLASVCLTVMTTISARVLMRCVMLTMTTASSAEETVTPMTDAAQVSGYSVDHEYCHR